MNNKISIKKNSNETYFVTITEAGRTYEIPSVNMVFAAGTKSDWLVKVTEVSRYTADALEFGTITE